MEASTATQKPQESFFSNPTATHVLTTEALFGEKKEIIILHKGESYRLRITRQEKLILTK